MEETGVTTNLRICTTIVIPPTCILVNITTGQKQLHDNCTKYILIICSIVKVPCKLLFYALSGSDNL